MGHWDEGSVWEELLAASGQGGLYQVEGTAWLKAKEAGGLRAVGEGRGSLQGGMRAGRPWGPLQGLGLYEFPVAAVTANYHK